MSWFRLARVGGAILFLLAVLEPAAAEPRRVLLLHSFGPHFAPWSFVSDRFREELIKQSPDAIDLFESSLESARFAPAQDEGPFVDYLRALFAGRNLDLVVAMGAPAARFFQRHRSQLFPSTPLLITGADERTIAGGALTPNDTAVAVTVEPLKIIENIFQVLPDTTNIAVVIGNSEVERFWVRELRHEFQRFSNRVTFEWWNELSLEDMLKRAASLPPHSAIFHTEVRVDAVGVPHAHDQVLARLRGAAKAPIFSYLDNRLGHGIVGGPLLSSRDLGRQAATVAVRILGGETAGNIKTAVQGLGAPTYDWRELQRWNISEARLPPGSVVLFKQPTLWEQHRKLVLTTVGVLALLISILVGLSIQMIRRKRAEASLKRSEERMAFAAASSNTGLWQYDVATRQLWATDHCRSMFDLDTGPLSPARFLRTIHPDDRRLAAAAVRSAIYAGQTLGRNEFRVVRGNGQIGWLSASGHVEFEGAKPVRVSGVIMDITTRKTAENEARQLSERMSTVQDEDRRQIAQELHDSTMQHLTAMGLNIMNLKARVVSDAKTRMLCEDIEGSLDEASRELRTFTYLLHPPQLEIDGLRSTLHRFVKGFSTRTGLKTTLSISRNADELPMAVQRSLLRVVQEALANVHRHASASQISITLKRMADQIHLVVRDNGKGIQDIPKCQFGIAPKMGLGIPGMMARVRKLDGELNIQTDATGTTLHGMFPANFPARDHELVQKH